MSVARIAHRYAKSLLELAVEQNALEAVHDDVLSFIKATDTRELDLFLKSPIIRSDKKQKVMDAIFGDKFHEVTNGFFSIIVRKGRDMYLKDIATEFRSLYRKHKHITPVTLTTAQSVSQTTIDEIVGKLKASGSTYENVELTVKVDPELIGGFVLEYDDKLFDSSVARKLDLLKKEFSVNEYIKNI